MSTAIPKLIRIDVRDPAFLRRLALLFIAVAGLVVVVAFVAICIHTGTPSPWLRIVHEDGIRTLVDTILYFDHAVRELPIDILLGMAIGGAIVWAFPPETDNAPGIASERLALASAVLLASLAVIIGGTIAIGGLPLLIENLCQTQTRLGAPPEWGAHWRYHVIERVALILISIGFAALLLGWPGSVRHGRRRLGLCICIATLAIFLFLTVVFSQGSLLLSQSFQDPQYIGHQAREAFTHILVTVPLAWGVGLLVVLRDVRTRPAMPPRALQPGLLVAGVLLALLSIVMIAYVCIASLMLGSAEYGQSEDMVTLLAPHFFEHVFTYLITTATAVWVYELVAYRWSGRPVPAT